MHKCNVFVHFKLIFFLFTIMTLYDLEYLMFIMLLKAVESDSITDSTKMSVVDCVKVIK